jgi:glycosyltransferase involved in cell wall biosynthesis
VFFFSTISPPFIVEDERILATRFAVDRVVASGIGAALAIVRGVARADVTLAWFGSVYAGWIIFLSRLLGKPSIVVVAGVDASRDMEIDYGIWLNPGKARVVRYAFRKADRVLAVSPFLAGEVKRLAEYDGGNVSFIPFGFDGDVWKPGLPARKLVTTVASCESESRLKKKGIDKLFEAARAMPDVPFRVIGMTRGLLETIRPRVPQNVEIIPYIPRSELLPYLQESRVYTQPSYTEGLPNALCEAMLCGCIPVGTIAGGIPTAIGDAGFLVPYGDTPALVKALREALDAPEDARLRAREHILREFPVRRREGELVSVIETLLRMTGRKVS